ncbi:Rrf2 family transcriptional regulator [Phycisphaerales bacterium AB-hyl4]|uniref:Rrf2 family transcriptional regulator n=1 Tax=Natronomicrosphaera hydrolytica TaxID=3242702 RepID=A0ABV4U6M7_9BACT
MLALSQTVGYALLALVCLEPPKGAWRGGVQIAKATGVPKPYLSKILHTLGRAGMIRTKRGLGGGFTLARPAEAISVMDVVEALDGRPWQSRCLLGLSDCSDERACPAHAMWREQRAVIEQHLRSLTLAEIARFEHGARGWLTSQGVGRSAFEPQGDGSGDPNSDGVSAGKSSSAAD